MRLTRPFNLPPLPYKELPGFSATLFKYHHGKHHKAYVENLNKLIVDTPFEDMDLDHIVQRSSGKIFHNAAQHWNHSFYWKCMTDKETSPDEKLEKSISRQFGSLDEFKKKFIDTAKGLFASGWVALASVKGDLKLLKLHNADCPIKHTEHPLLIVDVWEHAYYPDYFNDRGAYLESFWKVINWDFVNENNERI